MEWNEAGLPRELSIRATRFQFELNVIGQLEWVRGAHPARSYHLEYDSRNLLAAVSEGERKLHSFSWREGAKSVYGEWQRGKPFVLRSADGTTYEYDRTVARIRLAATTGQDPTRYLDLGLEDGKVHSVTSSACRSGIVKIGLQEFVLLLCIGQAKSVALIELNCPGGGLSGADQEGGAG